MTKKEVINGIWTPITGTEIEITYTIVGNTFEATGDLPQDYILVYAMDKDNRFTNYATVMKVEDVGSQNLPFAEDWNAIADPGYCNNANGYGDNFEHCRGAKIWAINENDLGTPDNNKFYPLTWSTMSSYYWETDLIVYSNDGNNEITLPANGGGFNFCVKNDFALNLVPDTYTIETKILPVI